MSTKNVSSVRQSLADHTRKAHEDLHHHRWISRLISPHLTSAHYYLVLKAYLQFYRHIEQERALVNMHHELHLRDAIAHLESDICSQDKHSHLAVNLKGLKLSSANSILGALYVLHGARFGAALLNKSVSKTLPEAPRNFLKHSTPIGQWRELLATIESLNTDSIARQELFSGADLTFLAFGKSVSEYCESRQEPVNS